MAVLLVGLLAPALAAAAGPAHSLELGGDGRVGGTVGHILAVPMAFALPGGGAKLKYRLQLNEDWHLRADARLSLGVDEAGELGGGYGLLGGVGYCWGDKGWTRLESELHLGVRSYSLIPVPAIGLHHVWGFYPVRLDWLRWDITLDATTDLLVIVPYLSAGVSTGLTFSLGWVDLGAEVGAEGGVLIAVLANLASGAVYARGVVGARF